MPQNRSSAWRGAHLPQLDGLRAGAVAAVVIHHYIPGGWNAGANAGVKLFFVLSGFLITGILVRSRNTVELKSASMRAALRSFYLRRFLRIFPLYYVVVGVAFALDVHPVREYIGWLLTYSLNIRMAVQGWYVDHFAHFWTLSVEEQFYLFWPWVVLFTRRRWLVPVALLMVAVAPLYRFALAIGWLYFGSSAPGLASYIATPACLDSLGTGALLGLIFESGRVTLARRIQLTRWGLILGLAGLAGLHMLAVHPLGWAFQLVLGDLFLSLVFCWLISRAADGFASWAGRLLECRPARYVGRISYGIYVYHPFMPALLLGVAGQLGLSYQRYSWSGGALATAATLAVSAASWRFIERPLNDLKRHFSVTPASPA